MSKAPSLVRSILLKKSRTLNIFIFFFALYSQDNCASYLNSFDKNSSESTGFVTLLEDQRSEEQILEEIILSANPFYNNPTIKKSTHNETSNLLENAQRPTLDISDFDLETFRESCIKQGISISIDFVLHLEDMRNGLPKDKRQFFNQRSKFNLPESQQDWEVFILEGLCRYIEAKSDNFRNFSDREQKWIVKNANKNGKKLNGFPWNTDNNTYELEAYGTLRYLIRAAYNSSLNASLVKAGF